jgi:starvation-inducible DNA-binding protein
MDGLINSLRGLLADVVALYFRAHGHHWNIEGPDFAQYHGLFGDIYEDIYGSIDPLAENIRKLGEFAPFRLDRILELKTLPDNSRTMNDAKSLAKDLLEGNEFLIGQLKAVFKVADSLDEQGVANFIADRIDMHQKWSWQLKASVK